MFQSDSFVFAKSSNPDTVYMPELFKTLIQLGFTFSRDDRGIFKTLPNGFKIIVTVGGYDEDGYTSYNAVIESENSAVTESGFIWDVKGFCKMYDTVANKKSSKLQ